MCGKTLLAKFAMEGSQLSVKWNKTNDEIHSPYPIPGCQ